MIISEIFLGFLLSLFLFISYIRHTIALNNIILCLMIITSLFLYLKNKNLFDHNVFKLKKEFIPLFLFLSWIITQPLVLYHTISKAPTEIKGQLLIPILFLFLGICIIAINNRYLTKKRIINLLFFTGFSHICIVIIMSLYNFIHLGYLPIRQIYILPVDEVSFLTNLVYAMFLTEIYTRIIYKQKVLYTKNWILVLFFIIFAFSVYLQGMRWGAITFSLSTLSFLILILYQSNFNFYKKLLVIISLSCIISLTLGFNIKQDKRWSSIIETISIVINDKSLYWVNPSAEHPCPKLKNGECVDISNYLRLAQQIHGYGLITDYPLGVGYSRYAYQNAINDKYNNTAGVFDFPHSGILNLLIGVGIPGIILYILFFYLLIIKLLKSAPSYYKFFTIFFIIAFHMRSFIDMTFMNHNLKVFMLLLGIGIGSSILKKQEKIENE